MKAMRLSVVALAALAGCAVGPDYVRPSAPVSATFKEAPSTAGATWLPAAPADTLERGDWWRLFDDAELGGLAADVDAANQTVAGAVASYRQAQALVRETRAAWFPTVGFGVSGTRSGGGRSVDLGNGVQASSGPSNAFSTSLNGDWAPDFWGRVGRAVEGAVASQQASAADLAAARLSAQGEMAIDYFSLREADFEADLIARTIEGYERSLKITQNRYDAGIVPKTDVLQAQTQLATTRSSLATVRANRERFEHAIAVLAGKAPGDFTLAPATWNQVVPAVPLGVPSALLQRRPDISSAERGVATATAQIGVERSAYFPSVTLSASLGNSSSRVGELFRASNALWSLGASLAQTVFDAGAISARVSGAEAARDVAVARYRQVVLTAFQGVEDQLTNARLAGRAVRPAEAGLRRRRSDRAADPQPLPRRPAQLHRRRHGASIGAGGAARAGPGGGRPAGQRDQPDPGARRRLGRERAGRIEELGEGRQPALNRGVTSMPREIIAIEKP